MIGAGVFAAIGPAAAAAGAGPARSASASRPSSPTATPRPRPQLAARYPASGGTYVYGRERLGHLWGFLAGWGFVIGKTASCAAMALTFGSYAAPSWQRPLAIGAVVALTAVNLLRRPEDGVAHPRHRRRRPRRPRRSWSPAPLIGGDAGPSTSAAHRRRARRDPPGGGLLFFAFAGYARIATLGEEVARPGPHDPPGDPPRARHHPRRVRRRRRHRARGRRARRRSPRPTRRSPTAVAARRLAGLVPVVRVGGTVASLGVLLSLLVGVSRTTFAMAGDRDLPGWLDAVHPAHRVPHRAELAVGAVVALLVPSPTCAAPSGSARSACSSTTPSPTPPRSPSRRRTPLAPRPPAVGPHRLRRPRVLAPAASIIGGAALLAVGVLLRAACRIRRAGLRGSGPSGPFGPRPGPSR